MPGPQSNPPEGKTKVDRAKGKIARRLANRQQREAGTNGRPVQQGQ